MEHWALTGLTGMEHWALNGLTWMEHWALRDSLGSNTGFDRLTGIEHWFVLGDDVQEVGLAFLLAHGHILLPHLLLLLPLLLLGGAGLAGVVVRVHLIGREGGSNFNTVLPQTNFCFLTSSYINIIYDISPILLSG